MTNFVSWRWALLVLGCLVGLGCRRTDVRTTEIRTPGVRSPDCAERVVAALSELRGVQRESITIDIEAGLTRLEYDSMMLALKNLETAITDAGYDANDLAANPDRKAELPPEHRAHGD